MSLPFTNFLEPIYKTIRFHSILSFSSVVLIGAFLAGSSIDKIVWPFIFSIFSTAFGFVINDLSDSELDGLSDDSRNPISTNELSKRKSKSVTLLLLICTLTSMSHLNPQNKTFGLVVIFLYFTYSWIIRAKARPILDVVYHGLCLSLLATIGYTECLPLDFTCLIFISIVFLLSSLSQILQEMRDYNTDRIMIRNTVILLGKRRSLIFSLMLIISTFPLAFLLFQTGAISPKLIFLTPLIYFIIEPIIRALINESYEERMLKEIKERRLILIGILITALIFL